LFYKEAEKQPVVLSFQSLVYHLEVFEKGLKLFDLDDFAVKPIQLVVSRIQPIVCLKSITKFMLCLQISFKCFLTEYAPAINVFNNFWSI